MIDEEVQVDSAPVNPSDEALLKRIRDRYREWSQAWQEARDHRKVLMRYLCGDPWDPKDRMGRQDAGRPCLSHDELNQYVFQCVNSARQSKRGIKIEPKGGGASEKTAELRQDIARTIEYQSKAQSVYLKGYQDEVEGGYGFCRVSRRYVDDESDDQEIVIRPIPNPDSVLYDPHCKEADWSDARGCFILDPTPLSDFKLLYPDARITDFGSDERDIYRDWIGEKTVLRAEYWEVESQVRKNKSGTREIEFKRLMHYITNGVEILDRSEQPGKEIPIAAFIGLERYVDDDRGGPHRRLFALPSMALDPQMTLAYLVSQEAEEAGLTPKSPYTGYVGQFETDNEAWTNLTKVPVAFVQADVVVDGAGNPLPLPARTQFTPNFQAYEVAKESARRAIQAAMGINPLPTAAQRQNEKSGVALQKIQAAQEVGSFHFVDGYERALERVGRIVDSWISITYDAKDREMWLHQEGKPRRKVILNATTPDEDGAFNQVHEDEDHDVTIGTAPSAASQEQAASEFLDLLVTNLANIPQPGTPQAKLLSLAIKMKELGPMGEEMAEIISPDPANGIPPAQLAQQAQQQSQQLHAYAVSLEQKIQEMQAKENGHIIDNQFKTDREITLEKMKIEAQITMAEINTKAQSQSERAQWEADIWQQFHEQAHDIAMQHVQAAHAQDLAAQQSQAAMAQQQQAQEAQPQEAAQA